MTAASENARPTARSLQAAETRQRLVDAAIELFSEGQYDDVAVGDIVKAAGVAHGLLFHYFGNKRGIYLEAMRSAAADLDVSHEVSPDLPPDRQVRGMFTAHLQHLARHRGMALRQVLGGRGADPEAWEFFDADRWRSIEWMATVLGLDPEQPAVRLMLRAAAGGVDEATAQWLQNGEPFNIDAIVEALVELTAAGLRGATCLDASLDVDRAIELLGLRPR